MDELTEWNNQNLGTMSPEEGSNPPYKKTLWKNLSNLVETWKAKDKIFNKIITRKILIFQENESILKGKSFVHLIINFQK